MKQQKTLRLQRWLDRLTAACDSRRWRSAVAEADCLSAELSQVREELWKEAENEISPEPFSVRAGGAIFFGARSLAVAVLIICLTTLPIAVESGKPAVSASVPSLSASDHSEFAIVTSEEKELLSMLRKSLNDSNIAVRAAAVRTPAPKKAVHPAPAAAPRPVVKENVTVPVRTAQKNENKIRPEDLLALIQIGEKSLHGGEPAIKIIN